MRVARSGPSAYLPLPPHEAARVELGRAFAAGHTLALLDGDPGSGKTAVALRFLADLPAAAARVFVPAAKFARPAELFQALLFDFGAEYRGLTEGELRLAVADQLLTATASGATAAVVLDEAQHLGDEMLEEVRLLGNIAGPAGPAACVLLVAQPGLRERLAAPPLSVVGQRLAVRSQVGPLDADAAARFVHALVPAGGIDDEATGILVAHCQGRPRLLAQAVGLAASLAEQAGVDAEAALEAVARLGLAADPPAPAVLPHPATRRPRKRKSA